MRDRPWPNQRERSVFSERLGYFLLLHDLDARFHQLLHQYFRYCFVHGETDDCASSGIVSDDLLMVCQNRRANVQAHIGRLVTEPCKHSVIVITFIEVSWYLEVTDCFGGAESRSPYSNPNFFQSSPDIFRTRFYVCVHPSGFDRRRLALCFLFHDLSFTVGCESHFLMRLTTELSSAPAINRFH
jgi:hypothetical protein